MREPCPCGSGRRYKACHGKAAAAVFVGPARPFEGLASECDIVAMREIVPAASAPLALTGEHADRVVTLVTVLPMAWPALVRADGSILLGLQINVGSGDASRDLADALLAALEAEPGEPVALGRVTSGVPAPAGPRRSRRAARHRRARQLRVLGRRRRGDHRRRARIARARQLVRAPDREAGERPVGLLDPDGREGAPALGHAPGRGDPAQRARPPARRRRGRPRRGHALRRDVPHAGPRLPGVGPARWARARRRSRSRRARSPRGSRRRWPTRARSPASSAARAPA